MSTHTVNARALASLLAVSCALAVAASPAESQTTDDPAHLEVTIDELRVPADPVFVLLDISPTAVEQPSTPRALGLALLQALEDSDGDFPQNLSIELSPYWMKSRPAVTFADYYAPDKSVAATVAQTFALSVATTQLTVDGMDTGTAAGIGVRFLLKQGRPAPGLEGKVAALKAFQLEADEQCVSDATDPADAVDEACFARYEQRLRDAANAVTVLDSQRRGFEIAFASAIAADIPDDETSDSEVSRYGAWLTASYRPVKQKLTFLGVARYLRNERNDDPGDAYDLGGRFVWRSSEPSLPLALSIEYVRRFVSEGDDTDRLIGVAEFDLPFQNLSILASYGKTFDDGFQGNGDLVSILGVNLGFGKGPFVEVPVPGS